LDKLGIDLEQRIKNKDFLKLDEIEAIANLASFSRSRLDGMASNKKIISFPKSSNKERSRTKVVTTQDYISKELIYRRLTNFAEYIGCFHKKSPSTGLFDFLLLSSIILRGDYHSK